MLENPDAVPFRSAFITYFYKDSVRRALEFFFFIFLFYFLILFLFLLQHPDPIILNGDAVKVSEMRLDGAPEDPQKKIVTPPPLFSFSFLPPDLLAQYSSFNEVIKLVL